MHKKPLLSFIIPVYNVEKYLNECLDSIFDPSVNEYEYEVIAVNDGSTDRSPEILKTYLCHKNFRIITQKNGGLGAARNSGIKAAKGKYTAFIDSDDYLLSGAVPSMLGWARQSDCDIIEFEIESSNESSQSFAQLRRGTDRHPTAGSGKALFAEWYRQRIYFPSVCIRIYRLEFLHAHSLYFMPIVYEDNEWTPKAFFYAETVVYYPLTLYHYRRREGSLMLSFSDSKKYWNYIKLISALNEFRRAIEPSEESTAFYRELCDHIIFFFEWLINVVYKMNPSKERTALLSEVAKLKDVICLTAIFKKGKPVYKLGLWLPAGLAIRIYKYF